MVHLMIIHGAVELSESVLYNRVCIHVYQRPVDIDPMLLLSIVEVRLLFLVLPRPS